MLNCPPIWARMFIFFHAFLEFKPPSYFRTIRPRTTKFREYFYVDFPFFGTLSLLISEIYTISVFWDAQLFTSLTLAYSAHHPFAMGVVPLHLKHYADLSNSLINYIFRSFHFLKSIYCYHHKCRYFLFPWTVVAWSQLHRFSAWDFLSTYPYLSKSSFALPKHSCPLLPMTWGFSLELW